MHRVDLPTIGTFDAWRDAARGLLSSGIPPEEVLWQHGEQAQDLFDGGSADLPEAHTGRQITVPKGFLTLTRLALWHRDPERFARAYALLCALQDNPRLIHDRGDARVAKLNAMAKEVGRDKHKMTAFVRFREIGKPDAPRRRFAAWFEPSHFITEPTAPFFAKRFGDMDWTIFTPDLTAHFEDGALRFAPGTPKPPLAEDDTETLWRTYFRSIFNPARVKLKAMQAEMPKKYWKNLPEADLIPEMVATARARAAGMAEAAPTLAPARAGRILHRLQEDRATPPPIDREAAFRAALQGCRRCPLWENATQPVPGEGALEARLMFVGEQPGDQEDLTGRPFVGPAGRLFDEVLGEAGIDRNEAYVTNAVKHFKFKPRGKRRLHEPPNSHEIQHCRWWLDIERKRVQPGLIVALGATALESLTGNRKGLLKRRSTVEAAEDGTPVFITVHPSFLLRLPDRAQQAEERALFRDDLRAAAAMVA